MNYGVKATKKRIRAVTSRKKKYANRLFLTFFKTAFVLVLFLCVTGVSTFIGMFKGILDSSPDFNPDSFTPSGYFSTIYNSAGEVTDTLVGSNSNRIEASYEDFPQDLIDAFVSIEDSRFWQHSGIDLRSISRAVVGVLTNNYKGGASTLTQQLIKNTVFNGGMETSKGSKIERKIQEQYLALQLTKNVDRKVILTNYLNTINLGSNTLGVKAAALRYFNKNVSDLTLSECAVIAGITQNPSKLNPISGAEANAARRKVILQAMYEQGYITKEEQEEALADDVYARIQNVDTALKENETPYSYYTDELISQVTEALKEQLGYTDTQASNLLFSGGLQIYTPQDPQIQAIVDEEVNNPANYDAARYSVEYRLSLTHPDGETQHYSQETLKTWIQQVKGQSGFDGLFNSEEEAQTAIDEYRTALTQDGSTVLGESVTMILEPQTSFVLIEQSTGYVKAINGGRGQKTANRTLNRATDSLRQPGSTFKVISSFAPALDACGATLSTVYYDGPYSSGEKEFRNWWGSDYKGYHTIRDGITYSMNIVALRCMADTVTPQLGVEYAERLGITSLVSQDQTLSTALGGLTKGVSNLELTNAFAAIANGGVRVRPVFYTKVVDRDGNVLLDNTNPEGEQVIKETTAYLLTDAMRDVVTQGTGTASNPNDGMDVAGKTGTTNDSKDLWFVGYTPYLTAGVWLGYDQSYPMEYTGLSETEHEYLWARIMRRIDAECGFETASFPVPDNVGTRTVCSKSGKLVGTSVCTPVTEYFDLSALPSGYCNDHIGATVCNVCGGLATGNSPSTSYQEYSSSSSIPNYYCTCQPTTEAPTANTNASESTPTTEPPVTEPPVTEPPTPESTPTPVG